MIKHDEYAGLAAEKHVHKQPIYAERGSDPRREQRSAGAQRAGARRSWLMRRIINNAGAAIVDLVSHELKIPAERAGGKTAGRRPLHRAEARSAGGRWPTALQAKLRRAEICAGSISSTIRRAIYPNGSMLCHVIGFTDFDHNGIQGVEASMDEYLHGQDGYRYIEHDRAGREIVLYRGQERARAQRLPGSSDDRSEPAEHRRKRNRRGDARSIARKRRRSS